MQNTLFLQETLTDYQVLTNSSQEFRKKPTHNMPYLFSATYITYTEVYRILNAITS